MAGLYFAYGSNMDADQMATRCAGCRWVATAQLHDHRYVINRRGVATVVPHAGSSVWGVLWKLDDGHEAELDRYEGVAGGLYRRARVTVVTGDTEARDADALVYVAADGEPGPPRPGYQELVTAAAETAGLPPTYVEELRGWL